MHEELAIRIIILEKEHFCLEDYVSEYSSFISYHLPAITNPAIKITIFKIARVVAKETISVLEYF